MAAFVLRRPGQMAPGRAPESKGSGVGKFDLVHQLTPISFIKPGYLWMTGLPFFWGPLGGMYKVPWDFARTGGMGSLLLEAIRSGNIEWHTRLSGKFRSVVSKAKRIWTISKMRPEFSAP